MLCLLPTTIFREVRRYLDIEREKKEDDKNMRCKILIPRNVQTICLLMEDRVSCP